MKRIHEETGTELEAFVHGALCYSYPTVPQQYFRW
ncbi:MAG: U32 family peptidase [Agathobacter rectalis]